MSNFGTRLKLALESYGHLCVGIDPSAEQLSSWNLPTSALGAERLAMELLDACSGKVGIVKPQVSFFEQFGPAGFDALSQVLSKAREMGFLVIADAKRGDIGSTMNGYARAWLVSEAPFFCDALTLSPYLGPESLSETIELAIENERGVFLLAATSNPESLSVQRAQFQGESVASSVASYAESLNESFLGSIGLVIGASVDLATAGISEELLVNTPVLVPGFGAQGTKLSSAGSILRSARSNMICSVSRSVAGTTKSGLHERLELALRELSEGMASD